MCELYLYTSLHVDSLQFTHSDRSALDSHWHEYSVSKKITVCQQANREEWQPPGRLRGGTSGPFNAHLMMTFRLMMMNDERG